MAETYQLRMEELTKIVEQCKDISKGLSIPDSYGKNKNTIQHDIENKIKEAVKTIRNLRDTKEKLEKELTLKEDTINKGYKSLESVENQISKKTEIYQKNVKKNEERHIFVDSVFDFYAEVGLNFEVLSLGEESADELNGTFKIGFSKVCPTDVDKVFFITIQFSLKAIKILETDLPDLEADFKKLEEHINGNLKDDAVNFKGLLVRARKLVANHLQSAIMP